MENVLGLIYETDNFYVKNSGITFVSREEGGHVIIKMKNTVSDRTRLSPKLAIEFIRLSMIVGEAFKVSMNNRGIPVVHINYQDMGNWAWKETPVTPKFHLHIFGRTHNAKKQVFPEGVKLPPKESGFYDDNKRLDDKDIKELKKQIELVTQSPKYDLSEWGLA